MQELDFYGYRFTSEGLKPTHEKCRAVKECSSPNSREEVKSFLGMIWYLSKFIPRYAVLTASLRRLTRQDVPFSWGPEENTAFEKLKASITSDDSMTFFDPQKQIVVLTEASISWIVPKNRERVTAYTLHKSIDDLCRKEV